MPGDTVNVQVDWALFGKTPNWEGYRLIASSRGLYSRRNFEEAAGRFDPGTPEGLPQVSVSYLPPGGGAERRLALAVRRNVSAAEPVARGVFSHDEHGRPVAWTSYFCVPYSQAAGAAAGYRDLARTLRGIVLPSADGPPLQAKVTAAGPPAPGRLACQAAALLMTGRPVCVLGADRAGLDERLTFLDAVMSLLPYGMRAAMAATTWARATNRDHRFRLFFSGSPRGNGGRDHILTWGAPDDTTVPQGPARDYLDFLERARQPQGSLARMTAETTFRDDEIGRVLGMARLHPARGPSPVRAGFPGALPAPARQGRGGTAGPPRVLPAARNSAGRR